MTSDKSNAPGLPPRLADALEAMAGERRSLQVIEQIFTDDPDDEVAAPTDRDAADAAMGARLAARTRTHALRAQHALGIAAGLAPLAPSAAVFDAPALDDSSGEGGVDGVVADVGEDLDTAKLLAITQAHQDHDDSRPG